MYKNFLWFISECEVRRLLEGSAKTYILDPMPTSLVIGCTQVLLPVLTKIIKICLLNQARLLITGNVLLLILC